MKRIWVWLLATALSCSAGCKKNAAVEGGPSAASFAVQAVVVPARVQPVSESLSLVGTVAANEMVEIKSETDGTVEKVLFVEGQPAKAGDLLLQLDESKFAAAVNEAGESAPSDVVSATTFPGGNGPITPVARGAVAVRVEDPFNDGPNLIEDLSDLV